MTLFGIVIGGSLGALARYRVEGFVAGRQHGPFPLSTLVVNVSGSFLLGCVAGLAFSGRATDRVALFLGTGFLGGFTTFSTFTYETLRLIEDRAWRYAWSNLVLSGPLSFIAAALGYRLSG